MTVRGGPTKFEIVHMALTDEFKQRYQRLDRSLATRSNHDGSYAAELIRLRALYSEIVVVLMKHAPPERRARQAHGIGTAADRAALVDLETA